MQRKAATAMLLDLRNFTASLQYAEQNHERYSDPKETFYHFLSCFYTTCLDNIMCSLPSELRKDPPIYINSTGDGLLAVFLHPTDHFKHAYLSSILIYHQLHKLCLEYFGAERYPFFGIGLDSGEVSTLKSMSLSPLATHLSTYVGGCINIAARLETLTKQLDQASVLIGPKLNTLLSKNLLNIDYPKVLYHADDKKNTDDDSLLIRQKMREVNQQLCLSFIHRHRFKGLKESLSVFRLSESTLYPKNQRFIKLITHLTQDTAHFDEVFLLLSKKDETP